jgi:hypothetical protein
MAERVVGYRAGSGSWVSCVVRLQGSPVIRRQLDKAKHLFVKVRKTRAFCFCIVHFALFESGYRLAPGAMTSAFVIGFVCRRSLKRQLSCGILWLPATPIRAFRPVVIRPHQAGGKDIIRIVTK